MFTASGQPSFGIGRAMAVSIVLHGLLLWPGTPARQTSLAAPPLTALLRPGALPNPAVPNPAERIPSPVAIDKHARPRAEHAFSPAPSRLAALADAMTATTAVADASTTWAVQRSEATGTDAPVGALLAPGEGVDAEGVRTYRLALAREARRYKRFPQEAIDAGWQGTAEVLVEVAAGGVAETPRLARSSGHAALDEAALLMLRQALPATPLPPTLRGRAFAVNLPVVFELPD